MRLSHESPGLKLDWCGVISLFLKKSKHFIKNKFFENLTTNREQGDWTIAFKVLFFFFFVNRDDMPIFHSDRNKPDKSAWLSIIFKRLPMVLPHIFNMRIYILSWIWVLIGSRFRKTFPFSSYENVNVDKSLSVT